MSYKTVKFGTVLDQLRRGMGYDPDTVSPTAAERVRDAEILDRVLEVAWQHYLWPQLMVVSQRYYRPDWDADVAYAAGEEVWRESGEFAHYCRAKVNHQGVDPATDTDEASWEVEPEGFISNIAFQQWWESDEIDGFDLNACVTVNDPLTTLNPGFVREVQVWEESLLIPEGVADSVYVRFRPARPKFGGSVWSGATEYATGDLVYLVSTREAYIALQPGTNKSPSSETSYWAPVGFPEFLVRYCVWAGVAEMQSEDSGKYKTQAKAEAELERLTDVHGTRSGQASKMTIRRYRRR